MIAGQARADIISQLKKDVLFQRFSKSPSNLFSEITIQPLTDNFHFNRFPLGAVHEFICHTQESGAASTGFIAAIFHSFMKNNGRVLWVSTKQNIFPPAFASFGLSPENIFFIHPQKEKDVIHIVEDALHCKGIAAVVSTVQDLNFKQSRRLQLATESSGVTSFVLRSAPKNINATASVARWNIQPATSRNTGLLPGVGFPCWKVDLLKTKNGKPGSWVFAWQSGRFIHLIEQAPAIYLHQKKAV